MSSRVSRALGEDSCKVPPASPTIRLSSQPRRQPNAARGGAQPRDSEPEGYTRAVSERKPQVGHKRRGIAHRFVQHRRRGRAPLVALLAVVGPGVLAGMSDDDPAGVTTYSILGTDFGYQLLWAIPISTALLVLFHLLAVRLAIRSGKGFVAVVRARYGHTTAKMAGAAFVLANFGTICAEFAGIGAVAQLAGLPTAPCVLGAAGLIVALVLAESFHRVEHVLLALSIVLSSYLVAGVLAQPDWSQAARARGAQHAADDRCVHRRDRDDRNDPRAMGPRVHPIVRGGQGHIAARLRAGTHRGRDRIIAHGDHRDLHRRGMRRHARNSRATHRRRP